MDRNGLASWWSIPREALIRELDVNAQSGLGPDRVKDNRNRFGTNCIQPVEQAGIGTLILEGIKQPMMMLLLAVAGLSLLFGKTIEATVMLFVVVAYVGVEFINKYRNDRTMTRLRQLTAPTTRVVRDGHTQEIGTTDVVVGDIVVVSEGSRVSADARLLEASGLVVNEAPLTGESSQQPKHSGDDISEGAPLAERTNSVFAGTTVLAGEGKAIVAAVGMDSQFGRIAVDVSGVRHEQTVLQSAMGQLARRLASLAVVVSALIPLVGFLRGLGLQEMVVTWLSLTFLMVPGQPPVIITMALALASFDLARHRVIVKRLHGAETLGQVTAILTDKTGTITENRMSVREFVLPDGSRVPPVGLPADIRRRIALAIPRYSADPTDTAIRDALGGFEQLIAGEEPAEFKGFESNSSYRVLSYEHGDSTARAIAGKPDVLIEASVLSQPERDTMLRQLQDGTRDGLRVVAYAWKDGGDDTLDTARPVALAVLEDPVRPGVQDALARLDAAGIQTYIVTGDHPLTTRAVAERIGLRSEPVTGAELAATGDSELPELLRHKRVFARVDPSQKLRLTNALKSAGGIVTVIGDGINDAPALKAADTSIAMGQIGTDLAKDIADLVLTDDDYTHVPDAIATGRKALDNFRKGLTYYLSAKLILISAFVAPLVLGIPFPLAPIHIIMTELLMDLASSTVFVTEAAEPDVMLHGPRRVRSFLDAKTGLRIARNGVALAAGMLGVYLVLFYTRHDLTLARTAAFTTWLLGHILLAINVKQDVVPLLKQGLLANRFAVFWLVAMIALTLAMTTATSLHRLVQTTSLPASVWLAIVVVVIVSTFWIELWKVSGRRLYG